MNRATFNAAAAALFLMPGLAAAQAPATPPPGGTGMPTNPYARPPEMGETDSATMPSSANQLGIGTQAASDARAAAEARRRNGPAVAAKPADIVAQAAVSDKDGQPVGTIESVDAQGAVVVTASGKVLVPLQAFGKNRKGLLIGVTRKEFDSLVAKANAAPAG